MKTSSFRIAGTSPGAISVALWAPKWFKGPGRQEIAHRAGGAVLAPSAQLLRWAKEQQHAGCPGSEWHQEYAAAYQRETLDQLKRPELIAAVLGAMVAPHEPILLCWERPGEFCHRRLLAGWFEEQLGSPVPELEPPRRTERARRRRRTDAQQDLFPERK